MPDAHRTAVIDAGLLDLDEEILLFYSDGPTTVLAHGAVLTDRRAVSYGYFMDSQMHFSARYDEIMDVTAHWGEEEGAPLSAIVVARSDGEALVLAVPADGDDDRAFLDTLTARWRSARQAAPAAGLWVAEGSGASVTDPVLFRGGRPFPAPIPGSPAQRSGPQWGEMIWISMRFGDEQIHWQLESETRHVVNGRTIDEVAVITLYRGMHTFFFDVTEPLADLTAQ
jgi:hypothetical protein